MNMSFEDVFRIAEAAQTMKGKAGAYEVSIHLSRKLTIKEYLSLIKHVHKKVHDIHTEGDDCFQVGSYQAPVGS